MLFLENASKHYYVTNEIMKKLYLFDTVLFTCRLGILLHKNFNISFNILLLLYGFHRFKQKMLTSAYFKRVT